VREKQVTLLGVAEMETVSGVEREWEQRCGCKVTIMQRERKMAEVKTKEG
jgi:hypothetical protein